MKKQLFLSAILLVASIEMFAVRQTGGGPSRQYTPPTTGGNAGNGGGNAGNGGGNAGNGGGQPSGKAAAIVKNVTPAGYIKSAMSALDVTAEQVASAPVSPEVVSFINSSPASE